MLPKDAHHLLAFLWIAPLVAAAPIFPNSDDIDENGHFLPEAHGLVAREARLDRRFGLNDVQRGTQGTLDPVQGPFRNEPMSVYRPTQPEGTLDRRFDLKDILRGKGGNRGGQTQGQQSQSQQPQSQQSQGQQSQDQGQSQSQGQLRGQGQTQDQGRLQGQQDTGQLLQRDMNGDLNDAIDDANSAIENIAGDLDPSFNPPDIPHLPSKRDIIGDIEGVAGDVINDVKGIFGKRNGLGDFGNIGVLCGSTDGCRGPRGPFWGEDGPADFPHGPYHADSTVAVTPNPDSPQSGTPVVSTKRDLFGDIEGFADNFVDNFANLGSSDKRDVVFAPGKRDFGDEIKHIGDVIEGTLSGIVKRRDLVGDINGAIDTANRAVGQISGDISPNLDVPDIPHIPSKRDLVGDINGAIDSANQAVDQISGDISPNLDVPDIPHIPSKRSEFPGSVTGNLRPFLGHGPVMTGNDGAIFPPTILREPVAN